MIKAVVFDLDNTLYAYDPLDQEAGQRVQDFTCRMLGISKDRYQEAYQFGRAETKRKLGNVAASHNRLLYFQKTLEYMKVKPMPLSLQMYEMYWGTFLEKMQLFPGARSLIDSLCEKGIMIAVCTDLTAHIQHRKLIALGLSDDIFCLVTSEEAGREKPASEMFALCLEKLGLPAEEVCYIGDNYSKDIVGAKACGMKAIWFHPEKPAGQQYREIEETLLSEISEDAGN
ncbi:MAG: HAD family hydrolase [Lachnospiraceae bacterium]|nr:HAD family hydrolase [Lachnospiraceae bacterium]